MRSTHVAHVPHVTKVKGPTSYTYKSKEHYKYKAKNKFMKAAAQQAQQPFKAVVKAAVQEAHARTTCYKHAAANIAGLVHT